MTDIRKGARALRAGAMGIFLGANALATLAMANVAQPYAGSFSLKFDEPHIALQTLSLGVAQAVVTQQAGYLQAEFKVDKGFTVCSCGSSVLQWHGSLGVAPGASWAPADGWGPDDTLVVEGTLGSGNNGDVTLFPGSAASVTFGSAPYSFVSVPSSGGSGSGTSVMVHNSTFAMSIQLGKLGAGSAAAWGGSLLDWVGIAPHMPSLGGAPSVDSVAALTISSITFRHAVAVPEVSTGVAMGMGMLALLWAARRRGGQGVAERR